MRISNSPIRIAVISQRYYPEGGGGGLATHSFVEILKDEFDVTVYTGTEKPVKVQGVKYVTIPELKARGIHKLWFKVLLNKELFLKELRKTDVVYFVSYAYPIIELAKKLNKKVIVHLHAYQLASIISVLSKYDPFKISKSIIKDVGRIAWYRCAEGKYGEVFLSPLQATLNIPIRRWICMADVLICPSNHCRSILVKLFPNLADKLKTVYNPIPSRLLSVNVDKNLDDTPTFLYIGGDSYIKGYHLLLKLIKRLGENSGNRIKFMLAGNYSHKALNTLNFLTKRYNLKIEVYGRIKHEEVLKLHSKAWALLFPSICEEPLPYAIVESLFLKTIPIASKVGGIPEIVSGTPAENLLIEPFNEKQFASCVEQLLNTKVTHLIEIGNILHNNICKRLNNSKVKMHMMNLIDDLVCR